MTTPHGPQTAPGPVDLLPGQFQAAWDKAAQGQGEPPRIGDFLATCPEEVRATVRSRLEAIDREYQSRTIDTVPPGGPAAGSPSLGSGATEVLSSALLPPPGPDSSDATGVFASSGGAAAESLGTQQLDSQPGGSADRAAAAPPPAARPAPTKTAVPIPTVPGYDLLEVLGRGGMGVVYKARQRGLKRLVALKMLLAGAHASEAHMARFQAEAEAVAQFQHPNIVQIHQVGQHEGLPFFSLEFVEGGSLEQELKRQPQPPETAARHAETLARAMAYAHQHGVIHRDLKPANVLIAQDGTLKITDFGLARRLESDSRQTASGTIMGTPNYMAPEQAAGRTDDIDERADVYALGAILYEMLTGRPPFQGASVLDTLQMVRHQEPVPPRQLNPAVPLDLDTITLKCLQKDPRQRYASAAALADDLAAYREGRPITARPVGAAERAWRWCRRNPVVAALTAAVAASLVVGTVVSVLYAVEAHRQATLAGQARTLAEANQRTAEDNARIARHNEQKARENEERAVQGEEQARQMAQEARSQHERAVKGMIDMVGDFQRAVAPRPGDPFEPERRKVRQALVESAVKSLNTVAEGLEQSGASPYARAVAQNNLAGTFRRLGRPREAARHYELAGEALKAMVAAEPGNDKARLNLAAITSNRGDIQSAIDGDHRRARDVYDEVYRIQKEVHDNLTSKEYTPEQVGSFLATTRQKQASAALHLGDPAAAEGHAREGLQQLRPWLDRQKPGEGPWLVAQLNQAALKRALADAQWRLGDPAGACRTLDEALDELRRTAARMPAQAALTDEVRTGILSLRGDLDVYEGRYEPAEALYRQIVEPARQALARDEHNSIAAARLAQTEYRLGVLENQRGRGEAAAAHFREALRLLEKSEPEGDTVSHQLTRLVFLARAGLLDQAVPLADSLREKVKGQGESLFQVACGYALGAAAAREPARRQALEEKALNTLRTALGPDYKDARGLEREPDLAPLQDNAAFRTLVAGVRARQAEPIAMPAPAGP